MVGAQRKGFLEALGARESGADYGAVNRAGYVGKYQMGEAALIDAGYYQADGTARNDWRGRWTGRDGVNSCKDFLASPRAQENAVRAYHKRVWGYVRRAGLDRYAGSTVGQVNITPLGLLAGAHLVGTGKAATIPGQWRPERSCRRVRYPRLGVPAEVGWLRCE